MIKLFFSLLELFLSIIACIIYFFYKFIYNFFSYFFKIFKRKKSNQEIIEPIKVNYEKELIDTNNLIEKNEKVIEEKETTIFETKLSSEITRAIENINSILFDYQNILCQNFDDDFPVTLLKILSDNFCSNLLKFILFDTRKITFIDFKKEEFLLNKPIYNTKDIVFNLEIIKDEIDRRYNWLLESNSKNIRDYNAKCKYEKNILPYIFITINDFFDIISNEKDSKQLVQEIILKGKKVGIIFILYTSVEDKYLRMNIVKNNITKIDAKDYMRTVEESLTRINKNDNNILQKLKVGYNLTNKINNKKTSDYLENSCEEPLYNEIVEFCIESGKVSASLIQRRFRLGYNRAAHIIDLLEERNIIGPANGSKPREVLIKANKNYNGE